MISSSSIVSAGYDAAASELEVEFWQGETYRYFDVPQSIYVGLVSAPSPGDFFNQHVRDAFGSERVR